MALPRKSAVPHSQLLQSMLAETSRTFALNIPLLPGKLYWSVLISYLLCRVLDTVEDSENLSAEAKTKLLREFIPFLKIHSPSQWLTWIQVFFSHHPKAASADLKLVAHLDQVLVAYWSLPQAYRDATLGPISTMAEGMQDFTGRFSEAWKNSEEHPLREMGDLERYCYYVAGTVGELLTACFCIESTVRSDEQRYLEQRAVSFGITLQLVNIVKDHRKDRQRGVCFIPKSLLSKRSGPDSAVILDLVPRILQEAERALEYVHGLSRRRPGVRLFCLWPLWLALATVEQIGKCAGQASTGNQGSTKISKFCLFWTLFQVSGLSWNKSLLIRDFRRRRKRIERYQRLAVERGFL